MSITIFCKREGCNKTRKVYPYELKNGDGVYCSRRCANLNNSKKLSVNRIGNKNPMYGKHAWNYIDGRGGKRHPYFR